MTPLIDQIHQRCSFSRLTEPAPDPKQLHEIFKSALNVPDHLHLRPWRFLSIRGDNRIALGETFAKAEKSKKPDSTTEELEKKALKALRAPLIIVGICSHTPHEKVPLIEQQLSTACVLHNLGLALSSLHFASVWRTGSFAFDETVHRELGLSNRETIMGYVYIGTADSTAKTRQDLDVSEYLQDWPS